VGLVTPPLRGIMEWLFCAGWPLFAPATGQYNHARAERDAPGN
jgi:hypothetical protein